MKKNNNKIIIIYIFAIFFTMLNISNIESSSFTNFFPLFDLMIIYYFTIVKKDILPIWFIFILGVWSDSLYGIPLGITSICYITYIKIFNNVNKRLILKENHNQRLVQFIIFLLLILLSKFVILSLYYGKFLNINPVIISFFVSVVFYLMVYRFFKLLWNYTRS